MKQAFLYSGKMSPGMEFVHSISSNQVRKELDARGGHLNSNNFHTGGQVIAFKTSKYPQDSHSPNSKPANKKIRQDMREIKKIIQQSSKNHQKEDKNLNRKQGQNTLHNTHNLNENQYNLKNKQSKETNRSLNVKGVTAHKKSDILSTERFKKCNYLLSPSRSPKQKAISTHSKKLLRSTQETFRATSKNRGKKCNKKSPNKILMNKEQPKEYILLQNEFLSIDRDEACMLDQKISPKNNGVYKKASYFFNVKPETYVRDSYILGDNHFQKSQLSLDSIEKVITIQRWWRTVLRKKHIGLKPIIFDDEQIINQAVESKKPQNYTQDKSSQIKNPLSPLQFIESNNSNISINNDSKEIDRKLNPLQLREQLAREELKVHKQLLEKLLKLKKISSETYFQKIVLTEAKFHNEVVKINDIKRILNENTKLVHEMSQKLKEDCAKIDCTDGEMSKSILDHIFGTNIEETQTKKDDQNPPSTEKEVVTNRQKSKGCHYQQQQSETASLYSKNKYQEQQAYEQDFEGEQIQEASQPNQLPQHNYNTNFNQILEQYKKEQEVAMEIDQRAAVQMGMVIADLPQNVANQTIGIDTSLNGIHTFLLSFFKFYICYYKDQFLRLINMPYGYDVNRRIKYLQGYDIEEFYPQEDEDGVIYGLEDIIHQEILDEYYQKLNHSTKDSLSTTRRVNLEFDKIHHRVLFDCFNIALNQFRPYFQINGMPYPWNYSEKALTFYCIAEENIQEVFQKTQFRVLKWASTLCGIIVEKYCNPCAQVKKTTPMEDALDFYKMSVNPSLFKAREERFNRDLKLEVNESNNSNWGMYEDQLALLRFQSSDYAFNKVIEEFVLEFYLSGLLGNNWRAQKKIEDRIGLQGQFYGQY